MNKKCLFCELQIIEEKILFQNEHYYVINDINPKEITHLLIITKQHFENFAKTNGYIIGFLQQTVKLIQYKFNINRFQLITNNIYQQEINHLHFHFLSDECIKKQNINQYDFLNLSEIVKDRKQYPKLDKIIEIEKNE